MAGIDLAELEGAWTLSRRIEDRRNAQMGTMEGVSVWKPSALGLVQEETGEMVLGEGRPMQATRRYLWQAQDGGLDVYFDDGRFFHRVPDAGRAARHDCDPDVYVVRYDWTWPLGFQTTWVVTGPRKDYTMVSEFRRA